MTNQNIEKDKIKFENLFKSFFADLPNTSICISNNKIVIQEVSDENSDPASVDLELKNEKYVVYFWDGYSLAETYEACLLYTSPSPRYLAQSRMPSSA